MVTTFSTLIVTRNRPEALALSLPLHLSQERLPERVLVIDSSDDPGPNRALVARLAATSPVPLAHQTAPPGMTLQRNIGLAQITSDVTFLPDDDSLVHEGALAAMLRVYDRDSAGRIGGVCAVETPVPPPGVLERGAEQDTPPYRKRPADVLRARLAPWRTRLEDRLFPDPMKLVARALMAALPPPEPWLAEEGALRVEWMTGFRMSFRTGLVRKLGFNERLGRYALYEDIDAGLGVMAGGHSLVAVRGARIYHHKAPENRTAGRQMGVINILNRAYVVLRSGLADDRIARALLRHARFRTTQFRAGAGSPYGLARLQGARAACLVLPELMATPLPELDAAYLRLRDGCIAGGT